MDKYAGKVIFLFYIILQVLSENRDYFKMFNGRMPRIPFDYYQFAIVATILAFVFLYVSKNKKIKEEFSSGKNKRIALNKVVIFLVLLYCIYQGVFINYLAKNETGMVIQEVVLKNLPRQIFMVIPLFYFFVLPTFKDSTIPIKWINISAVFLLVIIFINFTILGDVSHTDEGTLRLATGEVAVIFTFTLATSLGYFSGFKTNLILVGTALLGIISANHKSGYLAVALIGFVNIFNVKIKNQKFQKLAVSFAVLMLIAIPLSQTEKFSKLLDTFLISLSASTDFESEAVRLRKERWELAWQCFEANPVNGTMLHDKHYLYSFADDHTPHNFVYSILASQGAVGFGMIVLILASTFWIVAKNRADKITWQMGLLIMFYLLFAYANVVFFNEVCYFMLVFSIAMILHRNKLLGDFDRFDATVTEVVNARIEGVKAEEFETMDEDYQYLGKYSITDKSEINYEGIAEWLVYKYETVGETLTLENAIEHLQQVISVERPAAQPEFSLS
ncbi:MAG: O-antigen ligase family protein [Ignavibacteriales bacterium]|nr:MAG: O-antigen ligase family protein [Ignavibacteriales bacterium]